MAYSRLWVPPLAQRNEGRKEGEGREKGKERGREKKKKRVKTEKETVYAVLCWFYLAGCC